MNNSRRNFLKALSLGSAGLLTGPAFAKDEVPAPGRYREAPREIPVDDWADVIVAGGGPAGIACAAAAARGGAKVRLLEMRGSLGGVWTTGLLTYIFDFDKCDTDREIMRRLDAYGARRRDRPDAGGMKSYPYGLDKDWTYEPEYMRLVCEDLCTEAGVRISLHESVVAAPRDATGRNVDVVITESKSGRRAYRAKLFVDCTGDGDLAARAGCGFDLGFTPDGFGQPATLNALVTVADGNALAPFVSNEPAMWTKHPSEDKPGTTTYHHILASHRLLRALKGLGLEPSYGDPTLFRCHDNLFCFMANHEYRLRCDDADAVTAATLRARREIFRLVDALAKSGGPWKGLRLVSTAEQIGHRDARRIHGRYTVTREDVAAGRTFEDALTTSRFGIDIHGLDRKSNRGKAAGQNFGAAFRPFQIPLRACRAADVDNLYMAGRNISGDFIAQASYRVTGSSVALGEGVGRAVARLLGEIKRGCNVAV